MILRFLKLNYQRRSFYLRFPLMGHFPETSRYVHVALGVSAPYRLNGWYPCVANLHTQNLRSSSPSSRTTSSPHSLIVSVQVPPSCLCPPFSSSSAARSSTTLCIMQYRGHPPHVLDSIQHDDCIDWWPAENAVNSLALWLNWPPLHKVRPCSLLSDYMLIANFP